jgi:hypothetical protein
MLDCVAPVDSDGYMVDNDDENGPRSGFRRQIINSLLWILSKVCKME